MRTRPSPLPTLAAGTGGAEEGVRASGTDGGPAGTLVLCAGSVLMGDDGVGLEAMDRLERAWSLGPDVALVDGGTWGMNLLPAIESAGRLLVVDAVRADGGPGTVVRLEADEVPRFFATKLSPHQVDLKEVLALAELRGTLPWTVVLGVVPRRVELSERLSPEVEAAVPELVLRIVEELRAWGLDVRRAAPDRPDDGDAAGRPCAMERIARGGRRAGDAAGREA